MRRTRSGRGAATAELAVALPVLVAVTIGLAWFLALGVAQVRAVDAAREAARSLARGDPRAEAIARARRIGPAGSRVTVRGEELIRVRVRATVHGPGGILRWAAVTVHADAVASREDTG